MSVGTRLRQALAIEPYKYQTQGVRFAVENDGCVVIADEMGLGKTVMAVGLLALYPDARVAVVVVPATIKVQWKRQLWKLAKVRSEILEGRKPYRTKSKVLIINYQILDAWKDYLVKLGVQFIVFDECHYIKNRAAKCTKAAKKVADGAKHRLALSGTPIDNSPVEFYAVLKIVQPKKIGSFTDYAWEFCDPKPGFRGQIDYRGSCNLKRLHKLVAPFMIRRRKKDVLKQLPKKRRTVIPIELTNRKEYDRAKVDFLGWLEEEGGTKAVHKAKGAIALVRMGKLKLLAARGKLRAAINWIEDWLEESQGKLVVFAIHKEVLGALKKKFPGASLVSGGVPPRRRQAEIDRFCRDRRCRLFLGQLKAAGQGLDGLQAVSSTTLTLELAWNEAAHLQAEDRVNRPGQKSRCDNYYLVGKDTIEEWLLAVIQKKQIVVDKVLEGKSVREQRSLLEMMEELK